MTKRWTLPVTLGTLALLAVVGWLLHARRATSPPGGARSSGGAVSVGVEALVENPNRHREELIVAGIVTRVAAEQQLFSLADLSDREEVLRVGDTDCVTLPVRWAGPMPALHAELEVRGQVEESAGKLVFIAKTVTAAPRGSVPVGSK